MNYTPRHPGEDDRNYVDSNLDLAVALLDAHGARSIGLIDTVAQLEAELEITRDQREDLRSKFLQLQNQIAELLPAHDGDRANDPIIERVRRVRNALDGLVRADEECPGDDPAVAYEDTMSVIRWLLGMER